MKLKFDSTNLDDIIAAVQNILSGRELGKIVSLEKDAKKLLVKISKLGTSTLVFEADSTGVFCLASEKIALTHRAFKDEVKKKFVQVVKQAGGTVIDS